MLTRDDLRMFLAVVTVLLGIGDLGLFLDGNNK